MIVFFFYITVVYFVSSYKNQVKTTQLHHGSDCHYIKQDIPSQSKPDQLCHIIYQV